jgi:hypothetical protein
MEDPRDRAMVIHGTVTRDKRPKWEIPMDPELVDRIYECSLVPELWPGVLDGLAKIAEAEGGVLFTANTEVLKWTASSEKHGLFPRWMVYAARAFLFVLRTLDGAASQTEETGPEQWALVIARAISLRDR